MYQGTSYDCLPSTLCINDKPELTLTYFNIIKKIRKTGRIVQSVTCLATETSLTADPGVLSLIPAQSSNTFLEIDREIVSTVILLPFSESFKKGCCQV